MLSFKEFGAATNLLVKPRPTFELRPRSGGADGIRTRNRCSSTGIRRAERETSFNKERDNSGRTSNSEELAGDLNPVAPKSSTV